MQPHELTLSQSVHKQLQLDAKFSADEVQRFSQLARDLEQQEVHITKIDHGDLVVLADLLEKKKSDPQLADWFETFNEEYNRRIHTRSNC